MEDKRIHQFSLPLELSKSPQLKQYVKQHWNITFARQKKISVFSKRIMATVLAQIGETDTQLAPFYRFHVKDIATPDQDKTSIYKDIKKAFDELTDLKWLFEDVSKETFTFRHLLNTSDANLGYSQGWITVVLNPLLTPYFVALAKNYSTYELKWYMTFKSWYSMRLFELLAAFKDTGVWIVGIEEFRDLMDCKSKYANNTKLLLEYILAEPIKELENTKYAFTYKTLENEFKMGRGRKPIAALEFRLKHVEPVTIPKEWYQFSDEHRNILVELQRFKVTEKNIIRYANAIGLDGAKKLLKEWKEKDKSNTRIDNKEKYCNAVWVRVGKEYLKEKV
jgi:plasmid replication initiation protein